MDFLVSTQTGIKFDILQAVTSCFHIASEIQNCFTEKAHMEEVRPLFIWQVKVFLAGVHNIPLPHIWLLRAIFCHICAENCSPFSPLKSLVPEALHFIETIQANPFTKLFSSADDGPLMKEA